MTAGRDGVDDLQKIGLPAVPLGLGSPQGAGAGKSILSKLPDRIAGVRLMFVVGVVLPTLIAAIYYGAIASKRYVSEAEFVVRGMNHHRATGLDMLFQTIGLSRSVDDANAIQTYIVSRDAMRALNEKIPLREAFGHADFVSRFPRPWQSDSDEALYDYYRDRVSVLEESSKGITSISVQAFDPQVAQAITQDLLGLAEGMVNRMNARAQGDAVQFAQGDLEAARKRLLEAQMALTDFRTRELMIDPSSTSASVLDTITSLSTDLAHAMAEVAEAQSSTVSSPAMPALQAKVVSLRDRITQERAKIAGDGSSLAPRVATFDSLTLTRQLAERSLASADTALQSARDDARRQQIYIERIVSPDLPDEDTEPQRLRMILTVMVLCFALTSVFWILAAGATEHSIE